MAARQSVREVEVVLQRLRIERAAAAAADHHVLLDRVHDLEDGVQVQLRGDLLLHRLQEELLPGIAVEIRVEVAEPHVGEGVRGIHTLVSRQQIDLRHTRAVGGVTEIAVIDVEPDAAEIVHELRKAPEVDRDEVVDRQPRERAHGLDASERTTERERSVDPISRVRMARTFDRRDQVTGEREHGERVRPGIGPNEDQRVRSPRQLRLLALPAVGADHERDRGLARDRQVEPLGGGAVRLRLRGDCVEELMGLEVGRPSHSARNDDRCDDHPEHHGPDDLPGIPAPRFRLAVALHRRVNAGRVHRTAVAIDGRAASHASLQGGLHTALKKDGARSGGASRSGG